MKMKIAGKMRSWADCEEAFWEKVHEKAKAFAEAHIVDDETTEIGEEEHPGKVAIAEEEYIKIRNSIGPYEMLELTYSYLHRKDSHLYRSKSKK